MDYLTMLENKDLVNIGNSYNYASLLDDERFMFEKLFPSRKTPNLKVEAQKLLEGSTLPVMAQVHAFDSEARIGDRANSEKIKLEKLLIKEKLNQTERLSYYLGDNASDSAIKTFIYDDASNLISRVLTRAEVAKGELLSDGKFTVNENNVSITVDYGFEADHTVVLDGWSSAGADILGDIKNLKARAAYNGTTLVRAITSSKIIGYMLANTAINALWTTKGLFLTESRLLTWLNELFGIEFITNDFRYKTSILATTTKRFFDVDTVTFLSTRTAIGEGLWGNTPEEMKLTSGVYKPNMYVTVTQKEADFDPVALWTKASGVYLPVINDISSMYIGKVS